MRDADRLDLRVRQLTALEAVARHGSFGAAGLELGYSQSAVSGQIAALETVVGHRLLDRGAGPQPVRPTAAGLVVLEHARALLAGVDALREALDGLDGGRRGTLRVGTYQSTATLLIPAIVAELRAARPDVTVALMESEVVEEFDAALRGGDLDIAFAGPPGAADGDLTWTELLRDPYLLVLAPDDPLADPDRPLALADLRGCELVGYRACRDQRAMEAVLEAAGVAPAWALRVADNALVRELVAKGVGPAIVPKLAYRPDGEGTVARSLGHLLPARRIGLQWPSGFEPRPLVTAFVALAREQAAALAAADPDLELAV